MHRSSLLALAATVCAALALAPAGAAAKAAPQTCTTTSDAVVGGEVVGTLTSSNVDPVQASFATCSWAKKVMKRATELGVEEPRPVRSFYCRPTVSAKNTQVVSYVCTFRGADTATFIKLTFKVTYKDMAY
jgi:hypothetical protein